MKNLLVLDTEKLEELPKKQRRDPKENHNERLYSKWYKWRSSYPYKKVEHFLKDNRGNHIDEVYSKYCKLEWLDKSFKNREWFSKNVYLTTELKDNKILVHKEGRYFETLDDTAWISDCYYVHPESHTLKYWHRSYINWKKKHKEEQSKICRILGDYHQLLKLDGVWHEVKAEPIKSNIVKIDGRHWKVLDCPVVYHERTSEHVRGVERELVLPASIDQSEREYKIVNGKIAIPYVQPMFCWNIERECGSKDVMITSTNTNNFDKYLVRGWKWKSGIKLISCKQCGHKMLKKHGLKNDLKIDGPKCKKCGGIVGKVCKYHFCRKCRLMVADECTCF